jgi:hypothetical protein
VRPPERCSIAAILILIGTFAGGDGARAATQVAQVNASVVKPLILTRLQDLNLGTVTLGAGAWSGATVGISRAGVFSCANANLTCTGATQVAQYNVSGTNNQTVKITAPNVTLVNQSDSTQTLILVTDSPTSVLLTNSGPPGTNFSIGGSISLNSSTVAGTYSGTFNVTVEY